jgi:hypothetical protein
MFEKNDGIKTRSNKTMKNIMPIKVSSTGGTPIILGYLDN